MTPPTIAPVACNIADLVAPSIASCAYTPGAATAIVGGASIVNTGGSSAEALAGCDEGKAASSAAAYFSASARESPTIARRRRTESPGKEETSSVTRLASTCTDAAVAFLDALPDRSTFAPPWRRPLASAVVRAAAARASDAFYASGQSFEDRDDATFNRLYHAGPCLYQLALALDETDVTEGELLASAPWLEEAVEAVLGEEEEEEDSE